MSKINLLARKPVSLPEHLGQCSHRALGMSLDHTANGVIDGFVRQHATHLYRIAARVLGDPEDASDAVQSALTRLLRWVGRNGLPRDLLAFARTAVVRTALEMRRHRARRSKHAADGGRLAENPGAPSDDPAHQTMARAELARVLAAIERLPPRQRVAICLFELEGLSVQQVAEVMGTRTGTVKVHLHRARRALRAALEGDE